MTEKTPLWTCEDIAAAVDGKTTSSGPVSGVSIDSRTLEAGDLFVPLKGEIADGHAYIPQAIEKQAGAILSADAGIDGDNIIHVDDTLRALENLGQAARARCQATRIAVTGSAGKTGTKEMLGIVLKEFGKAHTSVKSYNNHFGVPLTLARMPADAEYGVFEMGMNHAGEISTLSKMVAPHIGIITTVLPAHIENFDDETGIARAKGEIVDGMGPDGVLIINHDNPHFETLDKIGREANIKTIYSFGEDEEADSYITSLKLASDGSKIKARVLGQDIKFKLSIPGKHIALNALAVLTAIKHMGLDIEKAAKILSKAEPIEGRGARIEVKIENGKPPLTIIDESYNAHPAAMLAAFKVLEMCTPKKGGRRIAVLGDMLELGPKGPSMHAELANPLLLSRVDLVFACGPQMEAMFTNLPEPWQGAHEKDSFALCPHVTSAVQPGDVILIKGSLGSKMAYVVEALQDLKSTKKEDVA